jgi:uncharacterized SAM-binding protein YcdF (DUF218 family)
MSAGPRRARSSKKDGPGVTLLCGLLSASRMLDPVLAPLSRLYEIKESLPRRTDCIVGLAAGLRSNGEATPVTRAVAERAASLYLAGVSPLVIFTGGYERAGRKEAEVMALVASEMGVPRERILLDTASMKTHHHPPGIEPFLTRAGARSIVVVSHTVHSRRVRAIFRNYYGEGLTIHFAKAIGGFELAPQRRYASLTSCLIWNVGTHVLAKLKGWA